MTGQYNVRNYVKFGMLDRGQTTFAHQLKAAGYATCIAGKWQLGNQPDSPQHFGFEKSCLWQHTRSGRSNENGKRIDRRFVNPMLELMGKGRLSAVKHAKLYVVSYIVLPGHDLGPRRGADWIGKTVGESHTLLG